MRNAKFVIILISLLFLVSSCGLVHLGEGKVNLVIDHSLPGFAADSVKITVNKISVHLAGHSDVDLGIDPVDIEFTSQGGVSLGSFSLDAGSYDSIKIEFGGGEVVIGGQSFQVELVSPSVRVPVSFKVENGGEVTLIIKIEGSSFIAAGGSFQFNPVVSVAVQH